LKNTIQSISNAEIADDIDLNVTIVNNNSTDNTENVIKEFANNDSKIKCLFEEKQGKSNALNKALGQMTGDLIGFTDDDIAVDKGWIKAMVDSLKRYPKYNCFGGKVVAVYPENMPKWIDIQGSMKFLKSVFVDREDGDLEVEYGEVTVSKTPSGCNMFFRNNGIKKNGFFRIDLGPVGKELGFSEDTEYCQRLLEKGERFMYIPSAIVYHPVHIERLHKGYLVQWQRQCGRSEVRRNKGYKDTRKIFGVPRYLYRKIIEHGVGWAFSIRSRKRFYHRLRFSYTAGEISEHFRM
jgi:cellulose synthase/poly-beta-1,6-N-acetylglucosamine synthase-like glycosyltransferase